MICTVCKTHKCELYADTLRDDDGNWSVPGPHIRLCQDCRADQLETLAWMIDKSYDAKVWQPWERVEAIIARLYGVRWNQ